MINNVLIDKDFYNSNYCSSFNISRFTILLFHKSLNQVSYYHCIKIYTILSLNLTPE